MKKHTFLKTALVTLVLAAGSLKVFAEQHQVFGFNGQVNTFNRGGGQLVVEDLVFRISESTLVNKLSGTRGTLSDITPGTRVGFYPGSGETPHVNEIWVLPTNWEAPPGYAVTPDN